MALWDSWDEDMNLHRWLDVVAQKNMWRYPRPPVASTVEEIAAVRHRVLEMEPRHWWWQPRYRLNDLERGGMSRQEAIRRLRDEWKVCTPEIVDEGVGTNERPR